MQNESSNLLSSMSPKFLNNKITTRYKGPRTLALKKYFRRSSMLSIRKSTKANMTVITISSTASESDESRNKSVINQPFCSAEEEEIEATPEKANTPVLELKKTHVEQQLPSDKMQTIENWVSDVRKALSESDEEYTSCNESSNKLTSNTKVVQIVQSDSDVVISPSQSEDDEISRKVVNSTTNKEIDTIIENNKEIAELLTSVYGDSWKINAAAILPASEPKKKPQKKESVKKIKKIVPQTEKPKKTEQIYRNPYLDSEKEFSNNLLQNLQRTRLRNAKSPFIGVLKNVCDSETDSDSDRRLKATKLAFDDEDKENVNDNAESSGSAHDSPPKPTKKQVKPKKKFIVSDSDESDSTDGLISKPLKAPKKKTYSFLESLSKSVPINECDASARIFRNNFKQYKDELVKKLFAMYNEYIFENKLPSDVPIVWNARLTGTAGMCRNRKITRRDGTVEKEVKIELSPKVLDSADRVRDTLVHEMCHAATWIIDGLSDGHGTFWKNWTIRAMRAFPELPKINTCHSYVINRKYLYKCEKCGSSVGRHTKSLNLETTRCFFCGGKLEVFINKVSKDGNVVAVPSSAKKTTPFAQFVKENYSNYRSPQVKHKDVMKILSNKFAELKVNM